MKTIRIRLNSADATAGPGVHVVKLIATNLDCPANTFVGVPDFGGGSDLVTLPPGASRKAEIFLALPSPDFRSFSALSPFRCRLALVALNIAPSGAADPTPANNTAVVELNINDGNDPPLSLVHDSVVKSLKPLKLTLGDGQSGAARKLVTRVVNADDEFPGHTITLGVSPGDCPPGTVGMPDFEPSTPAADTSAIVSGEDTASARIPITINAAAFTSGSAKSPARCTAEITASGPGVDPSGTNNVTRLVIDVIDKNDF